VIPDPHPLLGRDETERGERRTAEAEKGGRNARIREGFDPIHMQRQKLAIARGRPAPETGLKLSPRIRGLERAPRAKTVTGGLVAIAPADSYNSYVNLCALQHDTAHQAHWVSTEHRAALENQMQTLGALFSHNCHGKKPELGQEGENIFLLLLPLGLPLLSVPPQGLCGRVR